MHAQWSYIAYVWFNNSIHILITQKYVHLQCGNLQVYFVLGVVSSSTLVTGIWMQTRGGHLWKCKKLCLYWKMNKNIYMCILKIYEANSDISNTIIVKAFQLTVVHI